MADDSARQEQGPGVGKVCDGTTPRSGMNSCTLLALLPASEQCVERLHLAALTFILRKSTAVDSLFYKRGDSVVMQMDLSLVDIITLDPTLFF